MTVEKNKKIMTSSTYGKRAIAALIDFVISYGIGFTLFITGLSMVINDRARGFAIFIMFAGPIAGLIVAFWNKVFKEGKTGQSIGKAQMGISLVDSTTRMPLGPGRCFLREFVFVLLNGMTGSVFGLLDYLWPLWDAKDERLMDKIMSSRVVKSGITF